ncbi:MAG: hypothetical protein LC643_04700, partial [Bacteroidales bacterium]|nr:hypothetical protein [Bacteroidales bacterium]
MSAFILLSEGILFAYWTNIFLFSSGYLIGIVAMFVLFLAILAMFLFFRNRHLDKELALCSAKLNEAQQSNQSKDKLFSIVAHDLRSPFNSLLGLSEMLMLQS